MIVKLAIGGEKVSISENSIKLVNDKEYKVNIDATKYSRYHDAVLHIGGEMWIVKLFLCCYKLHINVKPVFLDTEI